jgi:hypothetical protein
MQGANAGSNRSGLLQWVIVLGVGVLVVTLILGLNLVPRLNAGQKVLNGARPAFQTQSLKADVAGINFISTNVNMANPIVQPAGGGASEIPALVNYAAKQLHTTPANALAAIQKNFPHTAALLGALPLSNVTAEVPKLIAFLSTTLKLPPAQVESALATNFPALTQAITNLPAVTNDWNNVPGLNGMTDFNGKPIKTVPELRDYFKNQLIPAVAAQQKNFQSLDGTSAVNWIAPALLVIAGIVIVFALAMIARNFGGNVPRGEALVTAAVVPIVGVVVVALVLGLSLIPRTSNGQKLLDGLAPAFTAQRVAGDRAGVNYVGTIIKTEDPIMTPAGGAAGEVPKLIAFVSSKTGLTQAQVLAALQTNFPAVTSLLKALPLSAVGNEIPAIVKLLGPGVVKAVPTLSLTIVNTPAVTNGWNNVPGLTGATTFNGKPIKTAPDVQNYFSGDVIPVLENQERNYHKLTSTSKINFIGPLVLIIGIVVIIYGILMLVLAAWLPRRSGRPQVSGAPVQASTTPEAVTV